MGGRTPSRVIRSWYAVEGVGADLGVLAPRPSRGITSLTSTEDKKVADARIGVIPLPAETLWEPSHSIDLSDRSQSSRDGARQPLEDRGEAQQYVVHDEPRRSLPSLAGILELEDHPFVLQQERHAGIEQADRRRAAGGDRACLPREVVRGLNAEPPAIERMGRVERDVPDRGVGHMADDLVDEVLCPVLVPLLPLMVAHHHMDPEPKRLTLPSRVPKGMLGDVGALAAFPALPLTRAEAHRGDHRVPLGLQAAQPGKLVELPVEVEATDPNATPTGIGEG